jgi:protein CpxP
MEEMRALRTAKRSGTITADQQSRLEAIRTQAAANMRSVHDQVLAILTPEQKAQLEQRKTEMKGHRGGMRHGRGMGGLRGIDLTDAQKSQIKALHEANKPSAEAMEEMKALHMAKRNGTITADQQTRLDAIKADAKAKRQSVHDQMMSILTPEQKAQIEKRKTEMKARREQMKGKMKERRQMRQQITKPDAAKDRSDN